MAGLLKRQGYEASGKQELAIAALAHGEQPFAALLRTALSRASSPAAAVAGCARDLADALAASGWAEGCPVAVTAPESLTRSPDLRAASVGALDRWQELIADRLRAEGWDPSHAGDLASTVLATLEGAELLSRVRAPTQHPCTRPPNTSPTSSKPALRPRATGRRPLTGSAPVAPSRHQRHPTAHAP